MAGYWVIHGTNATDQDAAAAYSQLWKPIGEKYGAKLLAAGGQHETPEGVDLPRNLLIEFPDYQSALDCYHDPAYREALIHVRKAYKRNLVILEGK